MPFVLDASVVGAWAFPDEEAVIATQALDRIADDQALVPALWWFEVRNSLMIAERRGRWTEAGTSAFLILLNRYPIITDHAPSSGRILDLSRRHRLTVYDASYVELAGRMHIPLASLDRAMIKAARAENIQVLDPH